MATPQHTRCGTSMAPRGLQQQMAMTRVHTRAMARPLAQALATLLVVSAAGCRSAVPARGKGPRADALHAAAAPEPRLLVLTGIGGDRDDRQSLVRLMAYANEFEIEGLIASAAGTPVELKAAVVRPDLVAEIVRAYGQVPRQPRAPRAWLPERGGAAG